MTQTQIKKAAVAEGLYEKGIQQGWEYSGWGSSLIFCQMRCSTFAIDDLPSFFRGFWLLQTGLTFLKETKFGYKGSEKLLTHFKLTIFRKVKKDFSIRLFYLLSTALQYGQTEAVSKSEMYCL